MKTLRIPLLLAILSISPLALASPLSQSETEELVNRIEALHAAKPSLQANFREERHMTMLKNPVVNEGKVWCTLPDKIRREIGDRKSTRLNSSHSGESRMPSSA